MSEARWLADTRDLADQDFASGHLTEFWRARVEALLELLEAAVRVAAGAGDPQEEGQHAQLLRDARAYIATMELEESALIPRLVAALAGDRPPAPSEAAKLAFLKAVSRIEEGLVLHDLWEQGLDAGLVAAYAVDFGAVRPTPRAPSEAAIRAAYLAMPGTVEPEKHPDDSAAWNHSVREMFATMLRAAYAVDFGASPAAAPPL